MPPYAGRRSCNAVGRSPNTGCLGFAVRNCGHPRRTRSPRGFSKNLELSIFYDILQNAGVLIAGGLTTTGLLRIIRPTNLNII
jgi:hypothetical protein